MALLSKSKGAKWLKMKAFTLTLAGLLAVLLVCAGGGPNPLQPPRAEAVPPGRVQSAPAPFQPWSPPPLDLREVEELICRFTNDFRQQQGLPPVTPEAALSRICLAYSVDMLNRRFFSHTNPEGLTATERLQAFYPGPVYGWGENLWEGSSLNAVSPVALARRIVDAWIYSPGHRRNLLGPTYTHMGVGIAANGGEIRVTQLFALLEP